MRVRGVGCAVDVACSLEGFVVFLQQYPASDMLHLLQFLLAFLLAVRLGKRTWGL